jgi:hypothetical protein
MVPHYLNDLDAKGDTGMQTRNFGAILSLLVLVAGFGPASAADRIGDKIDVRAPGQKMATREDHEMVAAYYENAAKEEQVKLEEQKQLLDQYENRSYLYGRQAQDLQSHAGALIRKLERSVDENVKQAALHRHMARQLPGPEAQRLSAIHEPPHNGISHD